MLIGGFPVFVNDSSDLDSTRLGRASIWRKKLVPSVADTLLPGTMFELLGAADRLGTILGLMIPIPKPRGFWDYALFALVMTGVLMFLFWLEASNTVTWIDAVLAFGTAGLFVLAIILARRGEKAKWIAQPTWHVYALATLGAFVLMFGAMYADAYVVHRENLTVNRIRHDMVLAVVVSAVILWSSRRRFRPKRSES